LDFEFWILDFGFWILDFGFWILDFGFWILNFGFWIFDGRGSNREWATGRDRRLAEPTFPPHGGAAGMMKRR
jgi:hypothetical protein